MFEPVEEQQQWQLEVGLAGLIGELQTVRAEAEQAEKKAVRRRQREVELLAEIRAHREQLGLPDTAVGNPRAMNGDGREPTADSVDGASGFRPFQSPQTEA